MPPLPDLPDLRQLRTQAKELKRALAEGDREAQERVLESHPKFAGRPADRVEGWELTLRDAQVTIAREHGFKSWRDLLAEFEGDRVERWSERRSFDGALGRAFKEAQTLSHSHTTVEHLLLAVLAPPEPTAAQEVLRELGFTYEAMTERTTRLYFGLHTDEESVSSTPAYQIISGFAQGIALGLGSGQVTDEHVLLALLYYDPAVDGRLIGVEVEADEIVSALNARGIPVPRLAPPVLKTPHGPFGPYVYFPEEDWSAVSQAIIKEFPPGSVVWGTNRSSWKKGYWYVQGEDEIPFERLVKSAVSDTSSVEIMDMREAFERESKARPAHD